MQEDRRRHVVPAHKGLLITFCTGATSRKRNAAKQNRGAEQFLMDLGFHQFRVRIHGTMARIEVPEEEILKIADNETRTKITEKFRTLGFSYVTLDLQGFRSGSMNETLGK